jgi:hypothetical protein
MATIAGIAILASATAVHAYTLVIPNPDGVPRRWPAHARSILFQVNQSTAAALPNVQPGSNVAAAIERALAVWPQVADIELSSQMTAVESVGGDGVNLITLRDTTANRMAIEMAGGPLGLALVRSQGNDIVEADVVVNSSEPFTTLLDSDDELEAAGRHDIEAVAAHEIGHGIGLHHSGVQSATMWSLSSVLQRTVDADDRAGARALYPTGGEGRIRGMITSAGAPVFGAHVVALSGGRVAASALTLPDGSYTIGGLDAGSYLIYAEPLDGPHSSVPDDPCTRVGNLSGAGIYNNATLDTDFATTFFGGDQPQAIQVSAGGEANAPFSVPAGATELNPTMIGPATVDGGSVSLRVGGVARAIAAGQRQALAVAGPGLDTVVDDAAIGFGDSAITLLPDSVVGFTLNCNGTPLPVNVFEVNVDGGAVSGSRSLILRSGSRLALMTGAVDVRGVDPPTPTPTESVSIPTATPTMPASSCVGDCDGGGTVTVDEIVTMVNIALGTQPVSNCLAGDSDGSNTITVDEILTAIQNALNGC